MASNNGRVKKDDLYSDLRNEIDAKAKQTDLNTTNTNLSITNTNLNNLTNAVNTYNTNNAQQHININSEIMDLKLKLREQNAINFLNKTGIGFYDTFTDNSNIDNANTTATYDSTNKLIDFPYSTYTTKATANFNNLAGLLILFHP
jgi:hypothetical protein